MSKTADEFSNAEHTPGSPHQGEPVFLVVGKIGRPHGVKGEAWMQIITDFPERIQRGARLYAGEQHMPVVVTGVRTHSGGLLVRFEQFPTREAVQEIRNQYIYVSSEDRPGLEEGEYYHHQLIGLRVLDEQGNELGVVSNVIDTGANDVYIVHRSRGQDLLLPATDEVILDVDLATGTMTVHLLEGLLPD